MPGLARHRFGPETPVPGLYVAGDWTDTGLPATMEGAVRTGYAAAAALTGEGGAIEDVPSGWLARRLGL